jgi:hypothetical protein
LKERERKNKTRERERNIVSDVNLLASILFLEHNPFSKDKNV